MLDAGPEGELDDEELAEDGGVEAPSSIQPSDSAIQAVMFSPWPLKLTWLPFSLAKPISRLLIIPVTGIFKVGRFLGKSSAWVNSVRVNFRPASWPTSLFAWCTATLKTSCFAKILPESCEISHSAAIS